MTVNDKITDKKIHHDINREVVKISAVSSGKIDKYEYMNILQPKKYYPQVKVQLYKKLNLLILL